jgi:hypothetical protein
MVADKDWILEGFSVLFCSLDPCKDLPPYYGYKRVFFKGIPCNITTIAAEEKGWCQNPWALQEFLVLV